MKGQPALEAEVAMAQADVALRREQPGEAAAASSSTVLAPRTPAPELTRTAQVKLAATGGAARQAPIEAYFRAGAGRACACCSSRARWPRCRRTPTSTTCMGRRLQQVGDARAGPGATCNRRWRAEGAAGSAPPRGPAAAGGVRLPGRETAARCGTRSARCRTLARPSGPPPTSGWSAVTSRRRPSADRWCHDRLSARRWQPARQRRAAWQGGRDAFESRQSDSGDGG